MILLLIAKPVFKDISLLTVNVIKFKNAAFTSIMFAKFASLGSILTPEKKLALSSRIQIVLIITRLKTDVKYAQITQHLLIKYLVVGFVHLLIQIVFSTTFKGVA